MINPFKKIIRDFNYTLVMRELYSNNAEFKGVIPVTSELYLVKDSDWYAFCIKPDWKKPIGVKTEFYNDGGSYNDWYCGKDKKISYAKEWRTSKHYYDIPEEMRKETINQIIDNCKNIEEILRTLKLEEWYE